MQGSGRWMHKEWIISIRVLLVIWSVVHISPGVGLRLQNDFVMVSAVSGWVVSFTSSGWARSHLTRFPCVSRLIGTGRGVSTLCVRFIKTPPRAGGCDAAWALLFEEMITGPDPSVHIFLPHPPAPENLSLLHHHTNRHDACFLIDLKSLIFIV